VDFLKVFQSYPRLGGILGDIADRGLVWVLLGLMKSNPLAFWTQFGLGVLLALYYLLALCGLFGKSCGGVWDRIALVAIFAYFVVVSGGPHSYSRFRHPAMPLLCVLAGCGLLAVTRRIEGQLPIREGAQR
jgi:hypothetical protein